MKSSLKKIGVQGWYLTQPMTGIGQHTLGLLNALAEEKDLELTVLVPAPVKLPKAAAKVTMHVLKPKAWILQPALKKWYWERVQVPTFFAKKKLDWEYYPYPSPVPAHSKNRRAMTVHDTILWDDPRYRGNRLKQHYYREAKRALIHVDHLFTVSQSTHDELGIPSATVLPNAIPSVPKNLSKKNKQNDLIYIGGYDIRKRIPQMIEAFAQHHKSHPDRRLLLVGEPHHQSRYYPKLPTHPAVKILGKLSDKELYSVLSSAFAFVHFSDREGFNIPLLQALAVGTPAVVPDLSVNREVSHGAALFFKNSSKDPLSAKLKMLEDPVLRKKQIQAGKKVAAQYSWKKSAGRFLSALKI